MRPVVAGRGVVGALSLVVLAAATLGASRYGGGAGQTATGIVGAVAFWFLAERVVASAVGAKLPADEGAPADHDPTLAPVLAGLEATRTATAAGIERLMRTRVPLGLTGGVGVWAWSQFSTDPMGLLMLGGCSGAGALTGYTWASAGLAERYRALYKAEVLPRLAAGFGALTYRRAAPPDVELLKRQRLFRRFNRVHAEDEIAGTYCGVPVGIVELRLSDASKSSTRIVFDGLLVRVTLPRMLSGTTAVIADNGDVGNLLDGLGAAAERVRLEDPAFEAVYQVYGTDQIAARALLTPAFMERLLALGERDTFGRPLALAQDNALTIALPRRTAGDLFEPPDYRRPAASRAALARLRDDLRAVLAAADAVIDLDHSVRGRS